MSTPNNPDDYSQPQQFPPPPPPVWEWDKQQEQTQATSTAAYAFARSYDLAKVFR